jgi:hypothetical protein
MRAARRWWIPAAAAVDAPRISSPPLRSPGVARCLGGLLRGRRAG